MDWEGSDLGLFVALSRYLPGGTRKTSVRIADVGTEVRTDHLPNTSLKLYRLNLLPRFEEGENACRIIYNNTA
jgi:hypothetical protein